MFLFSSNLFQKIHLDIEKFYKNSCPKIFASTVGSVLPDSDMDWRNLNSKSITGVAGSSVK